MLRRLRQDEPRQMMRDLARATTASRAARRGPTGRPRAGFPSRRAARRSASSRRARRSCPPTGPARTRAAATRCRAQPVEVVAVQVGDVVGRVVEVDGVAALAAALDGDVVDAAQAESAAGTGRRASGRSWRRGRRRTSSPRDDRLVRVARRPGRTARRCSRTHHSYRPCRRARSSSGRSCRVQLSRSNDGDAVELQPAGVEQRRDRVDHARAPPSPSASPFSDGNATHRPAPVRRTPANVRRRASISRRLTTRSLEQVGQRGSKPSRQHVQLWRVAQLDEARARVSLARRAPRPRRGCCRGSPRRCRR